MRLKLYEYAILWHPTTAEAEQGMRSILIIEPTYVLAVDKRAAMVSASMDIPSVYKDTLDQVEILVRPFLEQSSVAFTGTSSTNGNFYVDTLTNNYSSVDYNIIKNNTSNE